jgi:hypothetical protein
MAPEVEQDYFATVITQIEFLTVDILSLDVRNRFADGQIADFD